MFSRAGNVEMVEVIYDKVSGRSRGFGFVTMSTVEEVEAAAQQFTTMNAQPRGKLEATIKKFMARSMSRPKANDEDSTKNHLPLRSFGTVLARAENRRQVAENFDNGRKKLKLNG